MIKYTSETILEGLRNSDRVIIDYVYKEYFPVIRFFVLVNAGDESDAEDVFQDALVIIFRKMCTNDLELSSSFKTFLYSICRNLWMQKLAEMNNAPEFLDVEKHDSVEEIVDIDFEELENRKYNLYHKHFLDIGKECKKLMKLFYRKVPPDEIIKKMGYKNTDSLKSQKYLCKEKLINSIINDPKYKKLIKKS